MQPAARAAALAQMISVVLPLPFRSFTSRIAASAWMKFGPLNWPLPVWFSTVWP